MSIPDFQSIMRPLLLHLSDGREHNTEETLDAMAERFDLTADERTQLLPSGKQPLFTNRVAWAKFYLKKAGAVDNPQRGTYRIAQRGQSLLTQCAEKIDVQDLQQFPEFRSFLLNSRASDAVDESGGSAGTSTDSRSTTSTTLATRTSTVVALTPEEQLERAHSQLTAQLASELLDRIKQSPPAFFEELVVDLLLALGYGGSRPEAGRAVGKTGDGGIDGIVREDRLGLDNIYIQAKRWQANIGRPEVQKFAGALQGNRATKGVLITTSEFTSDAHDFVRHLNTKIVLIDGNTLSHLMIEHNVGVTLAATFAVKRLDSDYFSDD